MNKIFKSLPLASVSDIFKNVYDQEKKSDINELEMVLKEKQKPSDFLKSLTQEDSLTNKIYKKTQDGRFIFPIDKLRLKNPEKHTGLIGDLTNVKRKENLKEHTSLMINNVSQKNFPKLRDRDLNLVYLTALYYHSGEKYLSKTGHEPKIMTDDSFMEKGKVTGQIVSPEQEKLSAYLLARKLKDNGIPKKEAVPYVTATYYQNEEKDLDVFTDIISSKESDEIINVFNNDSYNLHLVLSDSDEDLGSYHELNTKRGDILKGEHIVLEKLDPFLLDITMREPQSVEEIDEKFYASSQADEFDEAHRVDLERELKNKNIFEQEKINRETELKIIEEQRQLEEELAKDTANLGVFISMENIRGKNQLVDELGEDIIRKFNHSINHDEGIERGFQTVVDKKIDRGLDISL